MVFYECEVFKGRDAAITKHHLKSMSQQLLNTAVSGLIVAFYSSPLYRLLNFDIMHTCCWKISGFSNFPTFCDRGHSVPKMHVCKYFSKNA